MTDAIRNALREVPALVRALNPEQRIAAVGAVLLLVSTFGPFSFVEAAEVLIALAVLALLRARAKGKRFHLPLGDGTVIAAAGLWAALLIVARLFDRPLGQNLLALACTAILAFAGLRERAKRPADDLPAQPAGSDPLEERFSRERLERSRPRVPAIAPDAGATKPLPPAKEPGETPAAGEQLSLPADEEPESEASPRRAPPEP
ncbi:MAG TPA: hypothetical protein VFQ12_06910 [Thermoleophilaceae bacterium]|nr:hypothetical protein [Thermoleophilaceae bacterium]